ncbi:TetR/AcrR family transcriptional regulator [Paenibacillus tuaregi]|uniref:TetR/AcrR family transcriptional regulator n=1 Tax=Paenibacillus tuaregi TaxID=1816681 RepID=UPI0008384843|nr:TetR/AcrR family transcriptional regulator [Paenibacillus tuaregi]
MTPRTKAQNEEIRVRRMAQIMKAAANSYVLKGINMEMRDVAAMADLGYGTVYHYYKNKYDLLADLLRQGLNEAAELAGRYLSGKDPSINDYCTTLLRRWGKDRTLFVLYKLGCEQFRELPAPVAGELAEGFRQVVIKSIAGTLKPGTEAKRQEQLAALMIAGLVGCAGLLVYGTSDEMNEEDIVKLLLAGFKTRGADEL